MVDVLGLKSTLLRGWREKWSDERWSIAIKSHIPAGMNGDTCQLAELLLEQALIGSSPNLQLLSYLRHAVATQMVSCCATISAVVRQLDTSHGHCVLSLLQFAKDTLVPNLSLYEDSSNTSNSIAICKSALSLANWLLSCVVGSVRLHRQALATAADRPLGIPLPNADVPFPYVMLVDKACDILNMMATSKSLSALLHIAFVDDADLAQQFVQLSSEVNDSSYQLNADYRSKVMDMLAAVAKIKCLPVVRTPLLNLANHSLNISVNVFVGTEAILSPTNDALIVAQILQLLQNMQGMSNADLYLELMRSCFLGIVDVIQKPDELKWAAFTFLKLPNIIHHLAAAAALASGEEGLSNRTDPSLWTALNRLLRHNTLLDMADSKCKCDCLHFLLHELSTKYSLITEDHCQQIHTKRHSESLRPPDSDTGHAAGPQQSSPILILRAEPTANSILSTLRPDHTKNLDAILGILCQMMSGKSFELLLSASTVTGKLTHFAAELIKLNETAKAATGENGKSAQTRALLFDISFLMLCHMAQLYGVDAIAPNAESSSAFVMQWCYRCLPDESRFKSLDLQTPAEPGRIEVLLSQLATPGAELKVSLTRWHEMCHTAPFAVHELLLAWQHGACDADKVETVLDNLKSTMCCLPVVVTAWLCSYLNTCDNATRSKALFMLERIAMPPLAAAEASDKFYNERSHLMFVILSKMVHGLVPVGSPSRSYTQSPAVTAQNASREVLVSLFRSILSNGCITVDDVHRMNSLLTVGGPVWFNEHLIRGLLTYDRLEDLNQGAGLIYALFHLDIDNLTLALLNFTLPGLLTLQSTTTSPVGLTSASTAAGMKLLTDPRGSTLARLCVMCLNLACTTRQLVTTSEPGTVPLRGKKPMRADLQLEDWEDVDGDDDDVASKWQFDDIAVGDGQFTRSRSRRPTFDEDPLGTGLPPITPVVTGSDDAFDLSVSEFLGNVGGTTGRRSDVRPRFDSKDLLSRSLLRLFRLMHGIISDKCVSPRSAFVVSFVRETLKVGPTTARFVLQFMPHSMLSLLVRTLPNEFEPGVLLYLCDLTTPAGRRTASKVIVQHARYAAWANGDTS